MATQHHDSGSETAVRDRILEGAFAAFMERGYAATSTLEIATRARVSNRELYETERVPAPARPTPAKRPVFDAAKFQPRPGVVIIDPTDDLISITGTADDESSCLYSRACVFEDQGYRDARPILAVT